ncbi:MAG TPA: ROK family protein, partial [Acetobacteraceae bacterium]|nr:ROK family protein [Acetobacteraceae bacterium]
MAQFRQAQVADPVTLCIDIGGTHLKAGLVDASGGEIGKFVRCETPHPSPPEQVTDLLDGLARQLGACDRVSVGFPGIVRRGVVMSAPKLGDKAWHAYPLAAQLALRLGRGVRIANDATVQGLGVIGGEGVECAITLGTGFGFALFEDGRPSTRMEMSLHPIHKDLSYNDWLGAAALRHAGPRKWLKRVQHVIEVLEAVVAYDMLYIGGGNARLIDFKLPMNVRTVENEAGILGGVRLWERRYDG